jgi:hypothetical protein
MQIYCLAVQSKYFTALITRNFHPLSRWFPTLTDFSQILVHLLKTVANLEFDEHFILPDSRFSAFISVFKQNAYHHILHQQT